MGLILCDNLKVTKPFFYDALGLHVYSKEELCYLIYEYPILALDDFFDNRLLNFIRDDLGQGEYLLQAERLGYLENVENFLISYLDYCGYYSSSEISKFKASLIQIGRLSKIEYYKQKADLLFALKKYGKAIRYYKTAIKHTSDSSSDALIKAKLYNNLGSSYANQFFFEEAYAAYDQAYEHSKSVAVLQEIYNLSLIDSSMKLKDRYKEIITDDMRSKWKIDFENRVKKSGDDDRVKAIDELMDLDSVKRQREYSRIINKWKKDYRNMI